MILRYNTICFTDTSGITIIFHTNPNFKIGIVTGAGHYMEATKYFVKQSKLVLMEIFKVI
jgi:hypothetical protein